MKKKLRTHLVPLLCAASLLAQAQPAILWQHALGGTNDDVAEDIAQTADGGSIMAGYTFSNNGDVSGNHGGSDAWVVKLSSTGAIQWQRSLGGTADDQAYSVQQTTDGGYIMAGYTDSNDGDVAENHGTRDAWVVKLDSSGAIEWQHPYGGTYYEEALDIRQTSDSGYIMAGNTESDSGDVSGIHGSNDAWVVKTNASGIIQWQHPLGGISDDGATGIAQTSDGGYIMAGYSDSNDGDVSGNHGAEDAWVVKLDGLGNLQWQRCLGETYVDQAESIHQTADGSYLMAGWLVPPGLYDPDLWAVKLDGDDSLQWQNSLNAGDMDEGYDLVETADGGSVVAGSSDGNMPGMHNGTLDAWAIKLDGSGTFQWQLPLGGDQADEAYAIALAPMGYLLAGYTESNDGDVTGNHGEKDAWVVKLGPGEVGVNEFADPELRINPNPASGPVHLSWNPELHPSTLSLMDAMGCVLEIDRMAGDHYVLDLENRRSGLYFVKVMFADGMQAIKRVVRE